MNWTIKGLDSRDYIQVNLSGTFNMASARAVCSEIAAQPFCNNGTSILIDSTQVDMVNADASDVECLTMMMEPLNEKISKSKIALVGSSDIQFGLARQFQIKAEQHTSAAIKAFRYEPAAIDWLTSDISLSEASIPRPTFGIAGIAFAAQVQISSPHL